MEPNVSDQAVAALYAPSGGIVCPFNMTIALAENACANRWILFQYRSAQDHTGRKNWTIETTEGIFEADCIVNAAGVYADKFHNMVSEKKLHITPRKGEYCLLDKAAGTHVSWTIFTLPGKFGKGVLVTPTIHGNLLIGPTATDIENKEGINTTREGLEQVLKKHPKVSKTFRSVR